ncbi:uncharacterized protein V1516DRAFT_689270 [Lipomyces oligophaga]|uniref:uncharacterized protein n=1 Tax=Lipomyces oligophaga TaxID=45792 RepID=UPI0034CEC1D1
MEEDKTSLAEVPEAPSEVKDVNASEEPATAEIVKEESKPVDASALEEKDEIDVEKKDASDENVNDDNTEAKVEEESGEKPADASDVVDTEILDAPPAEQTGESTAVDAMDVDQPEPKNEEPTTTNAAEPESIQTSEPANQNTSADHSGMNVSIDQAQVEKRVLEHEAKRFLVEQTHSVIIPSYAAWFDMRKINSIERKALPEFFNNRNRSKTPTVYRDYRDFMINTYRLNPVEYLTVTACRRNLAGDVCAIMRVHAFLEQWGLINYQVDPETRPSSVGPPFTGHFKVIADTPRGLQPFYPGVGAQVTPGQIHPSTERGMAQPPVKPDLNLEIRKTFYETTSSALASDTANGNARKTYNCFTCGNDCTRVRYHSMKNKQYDLCANCFLENRFPSTSQSSDFVKFEDTGYLSDDRDREWTDQETLLLLEGMELYDEDWNAVAEHVGTRTREQCVLKFLQLPIEDPYLEEKPESIGPLQYSHIPLSQADNPVMSVVAFLASIVDPEVAAAAAQSALPKMRKAIENQIEKSASGKDQENEKVEGKQENGTGPAADGEVNETVKKAASIALGTAAARAQLLATEEEREMSRLVNMLVNMQSRKLELKLSKFSELEQVLEAERREVEQGRQQLFLDRLAFQREMNAQQKAVHEAQQMAAAQLAAAEEARDQANQALEAARANSVSQPGAEDETMSVSVSVNGGTPAGVGSAGEIGTETSAVISDMMATGAESAEPSEATESIQQVGSVGSVETGEPAAPVLAEMSVEPANAAESNARAEPLASEAVELSEPTTTAGVAVVDEPNKGVEIESESGSQGPSDVGTGAGVGAGEEANDGDAMDTSA